MTDTPFDIVLTDPMRASELRDHVHVGHYFVFVDDAASAGQGRLSRLLVRKSGGGRVLPFIHDPVALPGVTLTPRARELERMSCAVTDRDLYRAGIDTAYVFCAVPAPPDALRLAVEVSGQTLTEREVAMTGGVAIEPLAGLLPGSYTAQLVAGDHRIGRPARFTVAEYTLAPLTGRLIRHEIARAAGAIHVELAVESYQVAFEHALHVELIEDGRPLASVVMQASSPGRYAGSLPLPDDSEGPLRLRLTAQHDPGRVAEVTIPGSRARERDLTVVSELGTEALFSLMPEPGAIPARGGFLTTGDTLNTPLVAGDVLSEMRTLHARADIDALSLVCLDVASGAFYPREVGRVSAGSELSIAADQGRAGRDDSPITTVFAGGYVNGRPFEGFATFFRPPRLSLSVRVPDTIRPRQDLAVELVCERNAGASAARDDDARDVQVLLCVRDQRLTATDTPEAALAASLKAGIAAATEGMADAGMIAPDEAIQRLRPPAPRGFGGMTPMGGGFGGGVGDDLDYDTIDGPYDDGIDAMVSYAAAPSFALREEATGQAQLPPPGGPPLPAPSIALRSYSASREADLAFDLEEGEAAAFEADEAAEPELAAPAAPAAPRAAFPEVLFYGLIPVRGRETVRVPLADSLGTFAIEAFALDDGDYCQATATTVVDQPVRADLDLPPSAHPGDAVVGRMRVAATGRARVSLERDGAQVALERAGQPGDPAVATAIDVSEIRTPAELVFPVAPGTYRAVVTDLDTGESDAVERVVTPPGKYSSLSRALGLLAPGDAITLESADALSLRVLPGLDQPMGELTEATADYGHLCCEQTAAKIMAAVTMYLTAKTPARRRKAEQIILAGVEREARMLVPGRGFSMYPDHDYISDYYSELATRYLWNLSELVRVPDISTALRDAAGRGVAMADQAARAHRIERVPARIGSIEDAYAVASGGGDIAAAVAFVETAVDFSAAEPAPRTPRHAVSARALIAYASAVLLAAGEWKRGLSAANWVTRQLDEHGRLYSTVDSAAAIAMMTQLRAAGVVTNEGAGAGRVRVNGRELSAADAAALSDQIESIEVTSGVVAVEVTRIIEHDWNAYAGAFQVTVGFRDGAGNRVRQFRAGDRADLVVSLPEGYRPGDLVHVCLPACMAWIHGGGKVVQFTADFEGQSEVAIPVVVTSALAGAQHFAVCARNMFEEERAASPGLIAVRG